jgi:hypothetical protein
VQANQLRRLTLVEMAAHGLARALVNPLALLFALSPLILFAVLKLLDD